MGPQVMQIRQLLPELVQVLLFSATFPDHVDKFAESITKHEATHIRVLKEDLSLDTITQTYIDVGSNDQKFAKLCELYSALNGGQSVIFVNTRHEAFELAKMMKAEGHTVSLICGTQAAGPERMEGTERDTIMQELRDGVTKVLIATDVLSRGIDVPAVTLVVNYDLPLDAERRGQVEMGTYMRRIGRTCRFGLRGVPVKQPSQGYTRQGNLSGVSQALQRLALAADGHQYLPRRAAADLHLVHPLGSDHAGSRFRDIAECRCS